MAMLALAARLARKARGAILTNNNLVLRDHLPRICPPLFPLFADRVFCSAQFRLAQPDPAIFHSCLHKLVAAPDPETGHASFRERVCQYDSTSGVAVPQQK